MDRITKAALAHMLLDFLDRPPPGGMDATFRLAVGACKTTLVVALEAPGLYREPLIEIDLPTPEAASVAAELFPADLERLECDARAARVVDAAAGGPARGAGRN